ncbi:disulfide bond formation protein B, partial [Luteimonas sp. 8-5]|uniref:disulfide bond formation protein B n=1 Tax=Luteimonas sp. 8-5 TaxID=3039387 RepID=UPI0024364B86
RGAGGRRAWGALGLLAAAAGIGVAGRHVWLQHLPADQVPMCGPGLDFLTEAMPLTSVIRTVLTGSGECANVDWTFLGLSMPEWSLLWFVLLAAWVLLAMVLPGKDRHVRA